MPAPFAPGRCSLYVTQRSTDKVAHQLSGRPYAPTQKQTLPRIVGAPAPGAIYAPPFAPRRCSYKSTALLPTVGAPAPGAIHARPVRTGAVLLHKNRPSPES